MPYHHLSAHERMSLFYMHQAGYSLRHIGRRLGRCHSSLSRELRRNAHPLGQCYCDRYAQRQALMRKQQPRHQKRYCQEKLHAYVMTKLRLGWSPQIIAQRIKQDYPRHQNHRISHEAIYQWIYQDAAQGGSLYSRLVRAHKKRRKQRRYAYYHGLIPNRIDISQRPKAINTRRRYGHWEGDTMVGSQHKGRIVTHVERKSRYLIAGLIKTGTAQHFNQATLVCYSTIPAQYRLTLTLDNGSENAQHSELTQRLNMPIYFARPYASWQRGTNENTNGLIRRFFPKNTNFLTVTKK